MRGAAYPGGEWEAVRPRHAPANLADLPNQRAFAVGTYYLAQMLAMSLPMGEVLLDDAASFYDGLVRATCAGCRTRCPSERGMGQTLTKWTVAPA